MGFNMKYFNLVFLALIIACQPALSATKYLQGDAIKSLDQTKTYTFSATQGVLPTTASISGDATMNVSGDLTLKNSGVSAGTYTGGVTVNAKGQVTAATASLDLTTGVTGVLPIANGGTNKNLTASAGSIAYSDADSLEFTSVGSNGQLLQSAGTGTPTWSSTITAPTISGDLTLSNGGIKFPATAVPSADANTLDDYEEGTFTPTVIGTSTAGAGTYAADGQKGFYTKIGNRVYFDIWLSWSAHTGTGNLRFSGLPFTVSTATNYYAAVAIAYFQAIALTAAYIPSCNTRGNSVLIDITQYPSGGGSHIDVPIDTAGSIMLSGSYIL
jgi:hypothetical protein